MITQYATPTLDDVPELFELIKHSKLLECNTEYAYLILAAHFSQSCAICRVEGKVIGVAIGYTLPEDQQTLFIWQVAVHQDYRGKGIAKSLIKQIIYRPKNEQISTIQATVSDSNRASKNLFKALASDFNCPCDESEFLTARHFVESHESEPLISVGPIQKEEILCQA